MSALGRLLRIAARNVRRSPRRAFLPGTAIALGIALVVFLAAFFDGFKALIMRRSVEASVGAVQVHRKGYLDSEEPVRFDMPFDEGVMTRLSSVPGVTAVSPRVVFEGLITNGSAASVVFGLGMEPEREYRVCPGRREVEGDHPPLDLDGALLGSELAAALGLTPGASASLLVQPARGGSNALGLTVKGVAALHLPLQAKTLAVVPLGLAQALLRTPGRVNEYALGVEDLARAGEVAAAVQAALGADYEVHSWRERDKLGVQVVGQVGFVLSIILLIAFFLLAAAINGTMQSAVNERIREIGTMLALGLERRQVMAIFFIEAVLLSLVFSALGVALGAALVSWSGGLSYTVPDLEPLTIVPIMSARTAAAAMAAGIVGAILAGALPARKASRASPIDALRDSVR